MILFFLCMLGCENYFCCVVESINDNFFLNNFMIIYDFVFWIRLLFLIKIKKLRKEERFI